MARPVKLYAPEAFAVVVALAAPLSVTVAPLPPAVGLTVPEMVQVCAAAVKLTVWFAPLTVTAELRGVKVKPAWLGVTV